MPQPVAFGELDLAREECSRHLVGLVDDYEIPLAFRALELLLHVLIARQLVETGYHQVVLAEPVPGARGLELVVGQDLEAQLEAPIELILPLLGEAPRAYDHAPLKVAAGDQLPDEETGHDGFARPGVIREQETQRLPGQHGLVDCRDLVRQGLDQGSMYSHHWVKQVRQADAKRLRDQTEEVAVSIKAPGSSSLDYLQPVLVIPIDQHVGDMTFRVLIRELHRV